MFSRKYGTQGKLIGGGGGKQDSDVGGGSSAKHEEEGEEISLIEMKKGLDLEKLVQEVSKDMVNSEAAVVGQLMAEGSRWGGCE